MAVFVQLHRSAGEVGPPLLTDTDFWQCRTSAESVAQSQALIFLTCTGSHQLSKRRATHSGAKARRTGRGNPCSPGDVYYHCIMASAGTPTSISHPSPVGTASGFLQASVVLLLLSPALLFIIDLKPMVAIGYFAFILVFLLMASPKLSYVLFLLSTSVFLPSYLGSFALHPFDIAFALAMLSVVMDFLLRTRTEIRPAYFDLPFAFLIAATLLSALFAYDARLSIVPSTRIIVVYLAFRLAFRFGLEIGVRKLLVFYILLVTVLSAVAFVQFALADGKIRAFGVTGLALQYFVLTALPMALAFLIWSRSSGAKFGYGLMSFVMGLGVFATQSRAPFVAVAVAIPVLLLVAYRKSRREGAIGVIRTMRQVLIPVLFLGVAMLAYGETLFGETLGRIGELIESIRHPQGTVAHRLVLWSAALKAFVSHPLLGIGIGNMRVVHEIIPEIRLAPLWFLVKGMSAHNVLLHYLAETGLIGATALVALFLKGLGLSYRSIRMKSSAVDGQVSAALFIAMFTCFLTMLYMRAWTWGQGGYILALVFGLNAAWANQLASADRIGRRRSNRAREA